MALANRSARRAARRLPPEAVGKDTHGMFKLKSGVHAGKWQGKVRNGVTSLGKPAWKRFGPGPIDEVIARRDEWEAERAAQGKGGDQQHTVGRLVRMTTGQWYTLWLSTKEASARTLELYGTLGDRFITPPEYLGLVPLKELSRAGLLAWRKRVAQDSTPTMANLVMSRLRTALEAAAHPDNQAVTGLSTNPARDLGKKLKTATGKDKYVPVLADTMRIVEALGDSYMAALPIVGTDLGLRRSELAGLQWGDVDFANGVVHLRRHIVTVGGLGDGRTTHVFSGTKASNDKPEMVRMSPDCADALRQAKVRLIAHRWQMGRSWKGGDPIAADAWVFPRRDGTIYEPNALGSWFALVCKKLGVAKSIHKLRHDCGSFLLAANVPLTVVSNHLRHANPQITAAIYSHQLAEQELMATAAWGEIWAKARQGTAAAQAATG